MTGETVGFEVTVRFYPGAEREAFDFAKTVEFPEQAQWVRLDRLVTPAGFEREQALVRGRSAPARALPSSAVGDTKP